MFVANRRRERAIELARRFGGDTVAFDALPEELERGRHRRRLDLVAARDRRRRRSSRLARPSARHGRPLLLIDLAVPRDIDPACAELPGVTLYDIDDLQAQVARTSACARPRRAGRGHRRGGDPDASRAGSARSRCCRR